MVTFFKSLHFHINYLNLSLKTWVLSNLIDGVLYKITNNCYFGTLICFWFWNLLHQQLASHSDFINSQLCVLIDFRYLLFTWTLNQSKLKRVYKNLYSSAHPTFLHSSVQAVSCWQHLCVSVLSCCIAKQRRHNQFSVRL